ncbi:MAG: LptF/LptG family permease [Candidatus Omnitrophica bacterium]|nr:LptF/LptG family permease [Candidatus Omnitrophota bacterium]
MKILRDYILREMFPPLLLSMFIITFAFLVGNLVKLADFVINKGVELIYVGEIFLFLIPNLLSFTIPMGLLTATLLAFGRLSSDNEIEAMRATGINLYKIALPAITLGLIFSLLSVPLNDKIVPRTHYKTRMLIKELGMRKPATYLEAGTFIRGFKDYILFIYEIKYAKDKTIFTNIRIYQPQKDAPTRTIVARGGELIPLPDKNAIKLKLTDGTIEEPNPTNPKNLYKLNFKTYYLTMFIDDTTMQESGKKTKEMTFDELKDNIAELKKSGIDPTPLQRRLHKRIAECFASFAFVLIGIPLAINTRRSEKSIGFGISLALIVIYWLLSALGTVFVTKDILPIWLAMWFGNIVLIVIGAIMMYITVRR